MNIKRKIIGAVAGLTALVSAANTRADVLLGTGELSGTIYVPHNSAGFELGITMNYAESDTRLEFPNPVWTEPASRNYNSDNSPYWAQFTDLLTNGINDGISLIYDGGTEGGFENGFFHRNPDFAGDQITSINFNVRDINYQFPDNWGWTTVNTSLEIYGVPEPSSAALIGAGALVLANVRRRK